MNKRDYLEWWNYHASCLTSCAGWLDKHDNPDAVHRAWQEALQDVQLEDALAATNAIVKGDVARPFPEETPAVVRRKALEVRHNRSRTPQSEKLSDEAARREQVRSGAARALNGDATMRGCLEQAVRIPEHLRSAFIDQYFDSQDHVLTADAWIEDPSLLITPKRTGLFATVPDEPPPFNDAINDDF